METVQVKIEEIAPLLMNRYFGWLLIALVVVLSSGAVYGQDKPKEINVKDIIVDGTVPASFGTFRGAIPGKPAYETRLFFEDKDGTIRMVFLVKKEDDKWAIASDTYDPQAKAIVIKRSE